MRALRTISKNDFIWTLLPAVLWIIVNQARPYLMEAHCLQQTPTLCKAENINLLDRRDILNVNETADRWSFITQNTAGVLSFLIPVGLFLIKKSPTLLLTDLVIVLQTSLWNGMIMESSRVLTQRPRPFVYMDVRNRGTDIAHYTSFYSGHTSYAAAASTAGILTLWSHGVSRLPLFLMLFTGLGLSLSTALFRVLAGRHFTTDVSFALLAGFFIALLIHYFHRVKKQV